MATNPTPVSPALAGYCLARSETAIFHGRHVESGTEVTIQGAGRCRFLALVKNPNNGARWVDVMHAGRLRSFDPSRVTIVHRTKKLGR